MPPGCPLPAAAPPWRAVRRAGGGYPPSQRLPPRRDGWRGGGCAPPAPSRPLPTRVPPRGREPHDRPTATGRVGSRVACARCDADAPARAAGEDGRPGQDQGAAQQVRWRAVSKHPSPRQWSAGSPSPPKIGQATTCGALDLATCPPCVCLRAARGQALAPAHPAVNVGARGAHAAATVTATQTHRGWDDTPAVVVAARRYPRRARRTARATPGVVPSPASTML